MIYSAGLLIFNIIDGQLKVLLVHSGGPHWKNRQEEGWGIPKGKIEEGEEPWDAAVREVQEELGQLPHPVPSEIIYNLGTVKQSNKKTVYCFAVKGEVKQELKSQMLQEEWPKGSGNIITFPEIGEMKWVTPEEAKPIMVKKQYEFIERLLEKLSEQSSG